MKSVKRRYACLGVEDQVTCDDCANRSKFYAALCDEFYYERNMRYSPEIFCQKCAVKTRQEMREIIHMYCALLRINKVHDCACLIFEVYLDLPLGTKGFTVISENTATVRSNKGIIGYTFAAVTGVVNTAVTCFSLHLRDCFVLAISKKDSWRTRVVDSIGGIILLYVVYPVVSTVVINLWTKVAIRRLTRDEPFVTRARINVMLVVRLITFASWVIYRNW